MTPSPNVLAVLVGTPAQTLDPVAYGALLGAAVLDRDPVGTPTDQGHLFARSAQERRRALHDATDHYLQEFKGLPTDPEEEAVIAAVIQYLEEGNDHAQAVIDAATAWRELQGQPVLDLAWVPAPEIS